MKALAGAGLLGFLAFTVWWMSASVGDSGKYMPIQVAFGNPGEKVVEMHTNVGVTMVAMDPLKDEKGKRKDMNDWVTEHFILTDSTGKTLKLERRNNSNVIKPHQVLGTQEFFIVSRLIPGEAYTFDFIPAVKGTKTFRHKFTAPAQPEKPSVVSFELVK